MENIFSSTLAEVTKSLKITGISLSKSSGVAAPNLSEFLNGHRDLGSNSLSRLFLALPHQAKKIYCEKLMGEPIPDSELKLADLIARLDPENPEDRKEAADAIRLIAEKMLK